MTNFKYQGPEFYTLLFDDSEKCPFEVLPGYTNVGVTRKSLLGAPKLYIF